MPPADRKSSHERRSRLSGNVSALPPKERVERLLGLCKGCRRALLLTHDNPDPDSIASAVALGHLLAARGGVESTIAYGGIVGRAENRALLRVLRIPAVPVSRVVFEDYELMALLDTQPDMGNHSLPPRYLPDVVIDHHPAREAFDACGFADVGGDYGATSTILVSYLKAAGLRPPRDVATALYYGIKADTRDLDRETTRTDIDNYLSLFPLIDLDALTQIEHPALPARYFKLYHQSIQRARVYRSAIVTDLGEVYSPDMVAEVAERTLFLEGMKWSLALGAYRGLLYISLRTSDGRMNAGKLIRDLTADLGGSAGGHGSMAGARLPLPSGRAARARFRPQLLRRFLREFGVQGKGAPLLDLDLP